MKGSYVFDVYTKESSYSVPHHSFPFSWKETKKTRGRKKIVVGVNGVSTCYFEMLVFLP